MERHVRILAILSSLWGALTILLGVSLLLLGAGAMALLSAQQGAVLGFAAGITAGAFTLAGIFSVLWGGASLWSGTLLRRHQQLGRILGLALAIVNLLVLPFGTALGIYALWVLLTDEARRLFESHAIS